MLELIKKLMGLTWTITRTGQEAMVKINEESRVFISKTSTHRGITVILTIQQYKDNRWENMPECWNGWWSSDLTIDQERALHILFNKAITDGKDEKIDNLITKLFG
jgi:hypothetical protein